ncbi:superoxide dismutase family protein [Paenibacillus tarimensis]
MSERKYGIKHLAGAFLCGSLFFSGIAMASSEQIEVSFQKLAFYVQGEDKSSADGIFNNNGKEVPESLIYQGTTYVPIRMVSGLLGQPVYWENNGKAVSIEVPTVVLVDQDGQVIGSAVLKQVEDDVEISIKVSDLTPGKHGFHIHQNAFTGTEFAAAGGHFNPDGKQHGHLNPDGHHLGDLPNLEVNEDGTAEATFLVEHATLEPGKPNSLLGRSLIIHAGEDDQMTDPSGDSGDRVAGGNIPN